MDLIVTGDDNDARGVTIEAVNDAWPQSSGSIAELVEVILQGSGECAFGAAPAGMYNHAGRFVDDDHMVVFVQDLQGQVFRLYAGRSASVRVTSSRSLTRRRLDDRGGMPLSCTPPASMIRCN